jgi:uncharacterized repeat protein (TIGR03803 family)
MKKRLLILLIAFGEIANAQYIKLHDFSGNPDGAAPYRSLISVGTFLYGMTIAGGINDQGIIFKIKPDGTNYLKLHDFTTIDGIEPVGSLISDGVFLYGMTMYGGTYSLGTLFKMKLDGTNYTKLLDFAGSTNGSSPHGSLIYDGTFLYGTTIEGGTNNNGTLFKIKPDGSGYAKLLDFAGATNGDRPSDLITDGTFLYGITGFGGANNKGTLYKITIGGSGYTKLIDFGGWPDVSLPVGALISNGAFLYGISMYGGTDDFGAIFKIKSDGSEYSKIYDFTGIVNGRIPLSSLITDGPFLYGTTSYGGTSDLGTIFKVMTDGSSFVKLLDFNGTVNGESPSGSLVSDGAFFYGTTANGGTNSSGTIFKYGLPTDVIESKTQKDFSVFPNPTSGLFTIQNIEKNTKLDAINLLGETIYSSEIGFPSATIDLNDQPNGIYFLNIKSEKGITVKKVVVEK